ncbi:ATP-binding protein [Streptomyces palmae]|uniref:ATP-binding protein n=1 Tax=Streptomyces palmae TaxID=1701085 RepID=A0A4Z0HAP3_9ACTN|nr:ATP-binding protein [Streptomyces palmae]TGB11828.1 ATP-binding protein [Streptomyces palmae]
MISRPSRHCSVELQALPPRIGQVRRIVSAQLRYWHLDALIDPAALGVTELLTNVHRHAEPDKRCTVEILLMLDRLTVSVRDHDPRLPRPCEAGPVSTHGRGLGLVAAVSESWGIHPRDDGGKVVWFTLAVPRPAFGNASPVAPDDLALARALDGDQTGPHPQAPDPHPLTAVREPEHAGARSTVSG